MQIPNNIIEAQSIIESIKADQSSKGILWSGNTPEVTGYEVIGTISNENKTGSDGIGDVYSFPAADLEEAFGVYREVLYAFNGTYTNLDPYQFHQVDRSKPIYVQFRVTIME